MTDSLDDKNEQPQFLSQESPGTRLRLAREAAGLTRGEVALHMHINERKVQALEEDNYDMFPSETFVSGFLRSYAKVLGLPEGDFVRPVSSTNVPPSLTTSIGANKQASSMDLPVRMVTYVIIAVVAVSLVMWWISQREQMAEQAVVQQPPAEKMSAVMQEQASVDTDEPAEEANDSAMVVEENATVADAEKSTAEAMNDAVVPVERPQPEQNPAVVKAEPKRQDPAMPPVVVSAVADSQTASTATEDAALVVPPLTAEMPSSKLVLEYQEDSWSEVDDDAGRRLVYGLMRAGQTIELKGQAPFKVFLGYAVGVTIHYNNELFDHSAFLRGEIARFSVGRAEDNKPGSR